MDCLLCPTCIRSQVAENDCQHEGVTKEEYEKLLKRIEDGERAMRIIWDPIMADKVLRGGMDNLSENEMWLTSFLSPKQTPQ